MKKNVVLIGFGEFGKKIYKELKSDKRYHLKYIIDDDDINNFSDVKIVNFQRAITILNKEEIDIAFFSITNISKSKKNHFLKIILKICKEVRILNHEFNSIKLSPSLNRPVLLQSMFDAKEFNDYELNSNSKIDGSVLLTGGSGYIGSHLLEILLENNHKVILLDNFLFGKLSIQHLLNHKNLEIIEGDICNAKTIWEAVEKCSSIISLAALVGDPACGINPRETMTVNYQSTKTIIDAANFYGINKLIFASSCSVYGASSNDEYLNETSELNPVSLYAKTRIFSEKLILEGALNYNPIILRLSTIFGFSNRMRFDLVVNLFVAQALKYSKITVNGGDQWRPFLHCYDAANAFYSLLINNNNFNIYNVGSEKNNSTILKISNLIKDKIKDLKVEISDVVTDERDYKVSFDRIQNDIKFNCKYKLDNGIDHLIDKLSNINDINIEENIYSNYKFMFEKYKSV